jgi:hypothetical protein
MELRGQVVVQNAVLVRRWIRAVIERNAVVRQRVCGTMVERREARAVGPVLLQVLCVLRRRLLDRRAKLHRLCWLASQRGRSENQCKILEILRDHLAMEPLHGIRVQRCAPLLFRVAARHDCRATRTH